jgi:shikimate 5-dehydrogenase
VQFKVYQIGHPLQHGPLGDLHNPAFVELGLPISYERLEVPPVNFHRVMSGLLRDASCLGAKLLPPYKQSALAYCQEVSPPVQAIGAINTLVRRPSGLIYGHNTDVAAFVDCLKEEGVKRVRTVLILGAGGAARVAIAGLREFGCARYLVGYRLPRRPSELSSHFKGIRRQMSYFPMQEMVEFFDWADGARALPSTQTESIRALRQLKEEEEGDGLKRWSLMVNATPLGRDEGRDRFFVRAPAFVRCADRIFDMVPGVEATELVRLARAGNVPVIEGRRLYEKQAYYSRELWLKEYGRHAGKRTAAVGAGDDAAPAGGG